jgi:nucleotide-binding universal stress UspA family protein
LLAKQEEPRKPDPEAIGYLTVVAGKLRDDGVSAVREITEYGEAAAVIIDTAQEIDDCLIAMTSHGRSGIGRWYLGSVAERVVRHAWRPVLITRASQP